jgi:hypothetical protein
VWIERERKIKIDRERERELDLALRVDEEVFWLNVAVNNILQEYIRVSGHTYRSICVRK